MRKRNAVLYLWLVLSGCSGYALGGESGVDAGLGTSSTSRRVEPASVVTVGPATGFGSAGVTWSVAADGSVAWVGGDWIVPLPVTSGDLVVSVAVPIRDNGAANGFPSDGNVVIAMLQSQTAAGSVALNYQTSDGTGNPQTLTINSGHIVQDGESMVLRLVAMHGGALPGQAVHPSTVGLIRLDRVAVVTSTVPVVPPFLDNSRIAFYAIVSGIGSASKSLYVPLHFPVGTVIRGIRVRLRDPGAGSKVQSSLVSMTDNAQEFAYLGNSALSSGTATEETIGYAGLAITVAQRTQYAVAVYHAIAPVTASSQIYRIEIDRERTPADL